MEEEKTVYHVPAMLRESIEGLNIREDGVYIDATFGGGGHARAILERLGSRGRLYGFDQDAGTEHNVMDDKRFTFVRSNFRYVSNFMRFYNEPEIDGILADLGVSSRHLDDAERGFSFRFDGQLDMRMNRLAEKTAADVLNTCPSERLAEIFRLYGELSNAGTIASRIVRRRESRPLQTTSELLDILHPAAGREKEKKFLAQVFQALRIEVNDEMSALRCLLRQSEKLLRPEGRLSVISYHSLEDRLVKHFMKAGNFEGHIKQDLFGNVQSPFSAVGKMQRPSTEEVAANPRARSARLRVAKKYIKQTI